MTGHPAQTPAALDEANALLRHWCYDPPLGPCWDPGRTLLDCKYVGLEPMAEFGHVVRLDVPGMEKVHGKACPHDICCCAGNLSNSSHHLRGTQVTSLDACIGYLSSFSNYATFRKQQPGAEDPLEGLRRQLRRLLVAPTRGSDAAPVLRQKWPLFLLLARDPVHQLS